MCVSLHRLPVPNQPPGQSFSTCQGAGILTATTTAAANAAAAAPGAAPREETAVPPALQADGSLPPRPFPLHNLGGEAWPAPGPTRPPSRRPDLRNHLSAGARLRLMATSR